MFDKYRNLTLQLVKVQDNAFDGKHPNGFNPGHVEVGEFEPVYSTKYNCLFILTSATSYFHTSEVVKIEEMEGYDLVHTRNSVYRVTPLLPGIPGVQEKYSVKVEE